MIFIMLFSKPTDESTTLDISFGLVSDFHNELGLRIDHVF